MIAVSLSHLSIGVSSSFGVLCIMRILHGAISSAVQPLCYSMIADYFPHEKRSRANAILTIGKNFGVAFSSISIIFIKKIGWRAAYSSIGALGVFGGFLSMALMKNPEKIR